MTPDVQEKLEAICRAMGYIHLKSLKSFYNALNVPNHHNRYCVLWAWATEKAITHKQFKFFVRNIKAERPEDFVNEHGTRILSNGGCLYDRPQLIDREGNLIKEVSV